jgi:hypothetical protein
MLRIVARNADVWKIGLTARHWSPPVEKKVEYLGDYIE